jgi:2-hydroxychromene-2-carboxylate isomerase
MKHITFYLDFVSPYAYLAFERLPLALEGLSYQVSYKPVLLGALLRHHGQRAPVEIDAKRTWAYRHIQWLALDHGVPLAMPTQHPFNPLPLLRLAIACGQQGVCNRYVAETIFRHVWTGGHDAADAERLASLTEQLAPSRSPSDEAVKQELRTNTEAAINAQVFGVPSMVVDDQMFWGLDALPMLRQGMQAAV